MKKETQHKIETMTENDLEEAVHLISIAMNKDEAQRARETFDYYFKSNQAGIDSGREYYILRDREKIIGLAGLHRYVWGPKENVWLSWFAVYPEYQNKGIGSFLIDSIITIAKNNGYKNLFVETYLQDTFKKARYFYERKGFSQAGEIKKYLPDGSSMIVYSMFLE